jgi:hypothetical protein
MNGSACPRARPTPVRRATTTDWTGGWVILMAGLRSVDNRKIPALTPVSGASTTDRTGGWVVLMAGLRGVITKISLTLSGTEPQILFHSAQCLETAMFAM